MGGEWQQRTLGDLTEWSSGGTPPKSNPEFWGGDIPWISASSMKTGRLSDSDRTLTPEGLEKGSRLARKGDVLLLVRGSELHKRIPVGIALRDVSFNQDVKALRAKESLDKDFLYYWLAGNETMLLSKVENTGIGAGKLDTSVPIQLISKSVSQS
jgi:type I restriction enzyme, S subunit